MNEPSDAAKAQLEAERDVELAPAQPDDATRIDGDAPDSETASGPAHVKHEHSGRMQH